MKAIYIICALVVFTLFLQGVFVSAQVHEHHGAGEVKAINVHRYIVPLGIITYISLLITFLIGLLKFKFHVKGIHMRWHYGFAFFTLAFATIHASLVLYTQFL